MTYTSAYSPYTKDGGVSSAALMAVTLLLLAVAVMSVLWAYSNAPGIPNTGNIDSSVRHGEVRAQ